MSGGERRQLDSEIIAWMREPDWSDDERRFDRLARALFAFQFEHCAAYARFCVSRGVTPKRIDDWREIPAIPTGAFKELALRCFPAEQTRKIFRTSGTSTQRRGELHLDSLELYEASLLPTLRRFLFPDLAAFGGRTTIRALVPSPAEAPDSSLSHMLGCAIASLGDASSGFDVRDGKLQVEPLIDRLRSISEPVALCGTTFAFVHLLERMAEEELQLQLPADSRIMETGGFKGRSREMTPADLYGGLESALGIPQCRIVNQYGMTELGSQFYDSVLVDPVGRRRKHGPPWCRVRLVDPETRNEVDAGETGMIVVFDLANAGSIASIETADLGRQIDDGFEILGRSPGAEERGCSIAADEMLAS